MSNSKMVELTEPDEPLQSTPILPDLTEIPPAARPTEATHITETAARGLDLVLFGTTIKEAARFVELAPATLYTIVHSEAGRQYMALQRASMDLWLGGLLYQAAAVLKQHLASPAANTQLRAAEAVLKYLGNRVGPGSEGNTADATAIAREILAAAKIDININLTKPDQPTIVVEPLAE